MKKLIAIVFFVVSYTSSFSQDATYMTFDEPIEVSAEKARKDFRKSDSTFLSSLTSLDIESFRKEISKTIL
jgi:hypothetical protein